jgi:hypothetical protein
MSSNTPLYLDFSGRIIDHLGIQMYQSPIAAIAEMISNAWDADAENVEIMLPTSITETSEIIIKDNGLGMTFEACQKKYLTTGYDARGGNPEAKSSEKHRFLMGRKGIGKFAGFGIAKIIKIETISKETGEKTIFSLDLNKIRSEKYIGKRIELEDVIFEEPDPDKKSEHGTTITLKSLNIDRAPSISVFLRGLSKRFLINQQADNFLIKVNDVDLPDKEGLENAELVFPRDYKENEKYPSLNLIEDGWGEETLSDGNKIKWRIIFNNEVISEEDLKGISVFANKKIGQNPFLFNLSGSLPSNTGTEYIYGRVQADFVDRLGSDVISTERQRINWEHPATRLLLEWGQRKIYKLLEIWKERRAEEKERIMMDKLSPFATRLGKLANHERPIILQALRKLATVSKIKISEFQEIGNAVLTAWESGRLKELIHKLASSNQLDESELLEILLEAKVLTALHTAESVRSTLNIISGFEERIKNRILENTLRDFIAENPWLISSKWETFRVETRVISFLQESASEARLDDLNDFKGRMDLVLSSGNQLLVLEFMRPGLTIDFDHISRYEEYIRILRTKLNANTALGFSGSNTFGYLVADNLAKKAHVIDKIRSLQKENMECIDWLSLLAQSKHQWKEFLEVLKERAPNDNRLQAIVNPVISGEVSD